VPLPGTALVFQLYRALQQQGLGAEGNHALVKALEQIAGITLGEAPRRDLGGHRRLAGRRAGGCLRHGRLNVRAWRAAFVGLVPEALLAGQRVEPRARYWEEHLPSVPPERTWVAERDGRVIGLTHLGPSRDPDAPDAAELYGMYVEPEAVGTGAGRVLMAAAMDWFRDGPWGKAILWTLPETTGRPASTAPGDGPRTARPRPATPPWETSTRCGTASPLKPLARRAAAGQHGGHGSDHSLHPRHDLCLRRGPAGLPSGPPGGRPQPEPVHPPRDQHLPGGPGPGGDHRPGPLLREHQAALRRALGGETVSHILVTHRHLDHCEGAAALAQETGAVLAAAPPAPRRPPSRPPPRGGSRSDLRPGPDPALREWSGGPRLAARGAGHPRPHSDHLCFALPQDDILFTGDHVMGWSTSVVIPPTGT